MSDSSALDFDEMPPLWASRLTPKPSEDDALKVTSVTGSILELSLLTRAPPALRPKNELPFSLHSDEFDTANQLSQVPQIGMWAQTQTASRPTLDRAAVSWVTHSLKASAAKDDTAVPLAMQGKGRRAQIPQKTFYGNVFKDDEIDTDDEDFFHGAAEWWIPKCTSKPPPNQHGALPLSVALRTVNPAAASSSLDRSGAEKDVESKQRVYPTISLSDSPPRRRFPSNPARGRKHRDAEHRASQSGAATNPRLNLEQQLRPDTLEESEEDTAEEESETMDSPDIDRLVDGLAKGFWMYHRSPSNRVSVGQAVTTIRSPPKKGFTVRCGSTNAPVMDPAYEML